MPIVETKLERRADPSIPFFNEVVPNKEAFPKIGRTINNLYNIGKMPILEVTISEDGLTRTHTRTFFDLESYSAVDTAYDIEIDYAYKTYYRSGGLLPALPEGVKQYVQAGIDAPFTCTITYTYPTTVTEGYPEFSEFSTALETANKLVNLSNTGTQLIAVFQHNNSADFTDTYWNDYMYIEKLYAGGVTRAISYAMV
jgi:hypothetical protein